MPWHAIAQSPRRELYELNYNIVIAPESISHDSIDQSVAAGTCPIEDIKIEDINEQANTHMRQTSAPISR